MRRFLKWCMGERASEVLSNNKGLVARVIAFYSVLSIAFILINVYFPSLVVVSGIILLLKTMFVPYLIIKISKTEDYVKRGIFKRIFKFWSHVFNKAGLCSAMILGFLMVMAAKMFDMANPNLISAEPSVNWFIFAPTALITSVFAYFTLTGAFLGFIRGMTGKFSIRENITHSLYLAKTNWLFLITTALVYYVVTIAIKALSAYVITLLVEDGLKSVSVIVLIYSVGYIIDWCITAWATLRFYSLVKSNKDTVKLKM